MQKSDSQRAKTEVRASLVKLTTSANIKTKFKVSRLSFALLWTCAVTKKQTKKKKQYKVACVFNFYGLLPTIDLSLTRCLLCFFLFTSYFTKSSFKINPQHYVSLVTS